MVQSSGSRLSRVRDQLQRYEHPLMGFDAREKGQGVESMCDVRCVRCDV